MKPSLALLACGLVLAGLLAAGGVDAAPPVLKPESAENGEGSCRCADPAGAAHADAIEAAASTDGGGPKRRQLSWPHMQRHPRTGRHTPRSSPGRPPTITPPPPLFQTRTRPGIFRRRALQVQHHHRLRQPRLRAEAQGAAGQRAVPAHDRGGRGRPHGGAPRPHGLAFGGKGVQRPLGGRRVRWQAVGRSSARCMLGQMGWPRGVTSRADRTPFPCCFPDLQVMVYNNIPEVSAFHTARRGRHATPSTLHAKPMHHPAHATPRPCNTPPMQPPNRTGSTSRRAAPSPSTGTASGCRPTPGWTVSPSASLLDLAWLVWAAAGWLGLLAAELQPQPQPGCPFSCLSRPLLSARPNLSCFMRAAPTICRHLLDRPLPRQPRQQLPLQLHRRGARGVSGRLSRPPDPSSLMHQSQTPVTQQHRSAQTSPQTRAITASP